MQHRVNKLLVIPVGILLVLFVLYSITPTFLAQNADNVLRPLVGEKNTIYLESLYFGLQDKVAQAQYTLGQKTDGTVLAQQVSVPVTLVESNVDNLNLTDLTPLSDLPPLSGEGMWMPMVQHLFSDQIVLAQTFIRPDVTHPYAIVSLVQMDMKKLGLATIAGTYYPGGALNRGTGMVPLDIQKANRLLAAFNGGFQQRDGEYGMIVGNKTYLPLRKDIPVLLMYQDGSVTLTDYTGQTLPGSPSAIRQNGPYLIHNSIITPYVEEGIDTWGRTITNTMYTWRSGLGISADGNLIYAAGNSLLPRTLAMALLKAGAVNAIQLDINPPWVKFFVYNQLANGQYTATALDPSMIGWQQYLKGNSKDFFYVYKK